MAIRFDATEGGASANSYCSLAFANEYHESRLHNADWFDDFVKEKLAAALITASGYIDLFEYQGYPNTNTQALKFPRRDIVYNGGYVVPDAVPVQVKNATAQVALDYLRSDFAGRSSVGTSTVQGALQSIKAGSFQVTYAGDGAQVVQDVNVSFLSQEALALLRPFWGVNHSGNRLVRV